MSGTSPIKSTIEFDPKTSASWKQETSLLDLKGKGDHLDSLIVDRLLELGGGLAREEPTSDRKVHQPNHWGGSWFSPD